MDEITGFVERITFHNSENGFTVAQLQQRNHKGLTCIVGYMPGIQPGETVRCFGSWKNHLVHGKQFDIEKFKREAPADLVGIQKYLGSGLVKGIGPRYSKRIVEKFGIDTLNIIDQNPEKLLEIEGIGAKRIQDIKNSWQGQKSIRDVMVFLQSYGVSPSYAQKIFKTYGDQSVEKVKDNPYRLAQDIMGIGFKIADAIAQKMGIEKESVIRIDAGIEFVLFQLSGEGHACYPIDEFTKQAEEILETPSSLIESRYQILQENDRITVADLVDNGKKRPFIWARMLFMCEMGIAREIKRLTKAQSLLRKVDSQKALSWVQEKLKIELAINQKQAVVQAVTGKLLVITGGPGTGKSTITNAILTITSLLTEKIILAAPTGRAAKRMSEITGQKASTIHSLLEFNFKSGGFKRNRESPLDCDLIIVDESSMIDTFLMYSLLKAIPDHARVLFVGDINQLPSVGPGNVLRDIINSKAVPTVTLNEIFRQAAGSDIITNAHKVNNGQLPSLYNGKDSDFFFIELEEDQPILDTIVKLVVQRVPHRYGFHSKEQIQVLAPMKRGNIGTENINLVLQQALNPHERGIHRGGQEFRMGDKVLQTRNNYQKEVFNGDIGIIETVEMSDQELTVNFDGRLVVYSSSELDELVLAYAISVHKFQGSECPCIIMPVHTKHFMLLNRNLLYTGITRGKKLVILVGTKKAIAIAVQNNDSLKRYTSLKQSLMELIP